MRGYKNGGVFFKEPDLKKWEKFCKNFIVPIEPYGLEKKTHRFDVQDNRIGGAIYRVAT